MKDLLTVAILGAVGMAIAGPGESPAIMALCVIAGGFLGIRILGSNE